MERVNLYEIRVGSVVDGIVGKDDPTDFSVHGIASSVCGCQHGIGLALKERHCGGIASSVRQHEG